MVCPDCRSGLIETYYHGVRIDECPQCLGRWFDRDEFRRAKDRTDGDLRWLDFDPFTYRSGLIEAQRNVHLCPRCALPMGTIAYEHSGVMIDTCATCRGVWLDHGEFEKIIAYLEDEVSSETVAQYRADLQRQFAEILDGSKGPIAELRDFFAVLHLLELRLAVERPRLAKAAEGVAVNSPLR